MMRRRKTNARRKREIEVFECIKQSLLMPRETVCALFITTTLLIKKKKEEGEEPKRKGKSGWALCCKC
jgi:hypothetical protein